jgi:hypothetical protein
MHREDRIPVLASMYANGCCLCSSFDVFPCWVHVMDFPVIRGWRLGWLGTIMMDSFGSGRVYGLRMC